MAAPWLGGEPSLSATPCQCAISCAYCAYQVCTEVAVSAELFLSAGDSTPMYQQIVDQITAKVMAGDWKAGQALPSIRELASASRVSVITVRRAYAELELAGIIVTRHGMGSFVAESSATCPRTCCAPNCSPALRRHAGLSPPASACPATTCIRLIDAR